MLQPYDRMWPSYGRTIAINYDRNRVDQPVTGSAALSGENLLLKSNGLSRTDAALAEQ